MESGGFALELSKHVMSLGNGFFEFFFSSSDDMRRVWANDLRILKPDILRFFSWTPDFNPYALKITHAKNWLCIFGLPRECWSPKILFSISRGVGVLHQNDLLGIFPCFDRYGSRRSYLG